MSEAHSHHDLLATGVKARAAGRAKLKMGQHIEDQAMIADGQVLLESGIKIIQAGLEAVKTEPVGMSYFGEPLPDDLEAVFQIYKP